MNDREFLLVKKEFPKSGKYDMNLMLDAQMGPNVVWLTEWLSEEVPFSRGARVLDLGCGKGLSSIFLAQEFGVRVWAADLWINPDNNWRRVIDAGVADLVYPIRTEAHALPFPRGFFDAIISIDAYQYFGTDVMYLEYISNFLRPGGEIACVMPGLMREFPGEIPEHLSTPQSNGKVFWEAECACFKTAEWWRTMWSTGVQVDNVRVATLRDGWRHWRDFEQALTLFGKQLFPSDAEALDLDQGRYIGFVRIAGTRTTVATENLYDQSICVRMGIDK